MIRCEKDENGIKVACTGDTEDIILDIILTASVVCADKAKDEDCFEALKEVIIGGIKKAPYKDTLELIGKELSTEQDGEGDEKIH